jgi:hypothetical protein
VNKSLDIGTLTQILSQRTQHEVKVGNIRTTLYNMFGEDASPMVKVFVNVVLEQLKVILPSMNLLCKDFFTCSCLVGISTPLVFIHVVLSYVLPKLTSSVWHSFL